MIKVEVSVIGQAEGRGLKHLPRPWLFRISQKPNLIIVLLYVGLKKITTTHRRKEPVVVVGNHALRAQPITNLSVGYADFQNYCSCRLLANKKTDNR